MASVQDNSSLLIYRVGPVLCCAPSIQIQTIIQPPSLTKPPGTSSARPGIFKHAGHIFSTFDLRFKFGVEEKQQLQPGRMILTQISKGHVGFWVDEIISVLEMPQKGWGSLPAGIPRGVFSRTLLIDEKIYLYAEFDKLFTIQDSGYLQTYIQQLNLNDKPDKNIVTKIEKSPSSQKTTTQGKDATTAHRNVVHTKNNKQAETNKDNPETLSDKTSEAVAPTIKEPGPLSKPEKQQKKINKPGARKTSQTIVDANNVKEPAIDTSVKIAEKNNSAAKSPYTNKPTSHSIPETTITHNNTVEASQPDATNNIERKQSVEAYTEKSTGIFKFMFILLLLLGGTGGILWYFLSPKDPTAIYVASESIDFDKIDNSTTPSYTYETLAEPHDTLPPTEQPATEASTEKYHASINQDNEGITIVLDAPANDPVFKIGTLKPEANNTNVHTGAEVKTPSGENEKNATRPEKETLGEVEIIHIVIKGDTLWHIAIKYVNNPYRYPELARLSNIRNPDLIYPGNRVRIIKRKRQLQ